jgi:hypothetical protein
VEAASGSARFVSSAAVDADVWFGSRLGLQRIRGEDPISLAQQTSKRTWLIGSFVP